MARLLARTTRADLYGPILDAVGEGYYEMDLQGTLMFASGALATLLGQKETDLRGRNIYDLLQADAGSGLRKVLDRVLHTGLDAPAVHRPITFPGSTARHLEFSVILACDGKASPAVFGG